MQSDYEKVDSLPSYLVRKHHLKSMKRNVEWKSRAIKDRAYDAFAQEITSKL